MIDLNLDLDLDDVLAETPSEPAAQRHGSPGITTGALIFDIETVPDASRVELFEELGLLPPLPGEIHEVDEDALPAPGTFVSSSLEAAKSLLENLMPPVEWIDAVIQEEAKTKKPRKGMMDFLGSLGERKDAVSNAIADRNKTMALCPEMCRIVAIGMIAGLEEPEAVCCLDDSYSDEAKEIYLLDVFWSRVEHHRGPLVGFNVIGFDLPVILARSAMLGVEPTRTFDLRPWGTDVCDLMLKRFGKGKATKLKTLARLYGIDVPAGDTDGGDVLDMLASDPQRLLEYVKSDVVITQRLYQLWRGGFC